MSTVTSHYNVNCILSEGALMRKTYYAALVRLTRITLHHVQVQTEFSILSMG